MVHPRGGKISSPYLVEAFGDQNPPKMVSYDMYWIIILFNSHLNTFRVEKVEESMQMTLFTGRAQFGKKNV